MDGERAGSCKLRGKPLFCFCTALGHRCYEKVYPSVRFANVFAVNLLVPASSEIANPPAVDGNHVGAYSHFGADSEPTPAAGAMRL